MNLTQLDFLSTTPRDSDRPCALATMQLPRNMTLKSLPYDLFASKSTVTKKYWKLSKFLKRNALYMQIFVILLIVTAKNIIHLSNLHRPRQFFITAAQTGVIFETYFLILSYAFFFFTMTVVVVEVTICI